MDAAARRGVLRQFGSVGLALDHHQAEAPPRADVHAEYAILAVDGAGIGIECRRIPFDVDELIRSVETSGMPNPEDAAVPWRHLGTPT